MVEDSESKMGNQFCFTIYGGNRWDAEGASSTFICSFLSFRIPQGPYLWQLARKKRKTSGWRTLCRPFSTPRKHPKTLRGSIITRSSRAALPKKFWTRPALQPTILAAKKGPSSSAATQQSTSVGTVTHRLVPGIISSPSRYFLFLLLIFFKNSIHLFIFGTESIERLFTKKVQEQQRMAETVGGVHQFLPVLLQNVSGEFNDRNCFVLKFLF